MATVSFWCAVAICGLTAGRVLYQLIFQAGKWETQMGGVLVLLVSGMGLLGLLKVF